MAGEIHFTDQLHEDFVRGHAVRMLHEIAVGCTCQVEDVYAGLKDDATERRRQPFCPRCGGTGWLYRDPVVVKGLLSSVRQQRNILDAGITQPGDAIFSSPIDMGERKIGTWDKLTSLFGQPLDSGHVLIRGSGTAGENARIKTDLNDDEDRLWYEPESAIWCEDDAGVVYHEGADFTFGPGKIIKWSGNQPHKGQPYVIKYNAFFEWIVYNPPQERRDLNEKDLGPLIMLRKRHIAFVNASPTGSGQSLQSRIAC